MNRDKTKSTDAGEQEPIRLTITAHIPAGASPIDINVGGCVEIVEMWRFADGREQHVATTAFSTKRSERYGPTGEAMVRIVAAQHAAVESLVQFLDRIADDDMGSPHVISAAET